MVYTSCRTSCQKKHLVENIFPTASPIKQIQCVLFQTHQIALLQLQTGTLGALELHYAYYYR